MSDKWYNQSDKWYNGQRSQCIWVTYHHQLFHCIIWITLVCIQNLKLALGEALYYYLESKDVYTTAFVFEYNTIKYAP